MGGVVSSVPGLRRLCRHAPNPNNDAEAAFTSAQPDLLPKYSKFRVILEVADAKKTVRSLEDIFGKPDIAVTYISSGTYDAAVSVNGQKNTTMRFVTAKKNKSSHLSPTVDHISYDSLRLCVQVDDLGPILASLDRLSHPYQCAEDNGAVRFFLEYVVQLAFLTLLSFIYNMVYAHD